MKPMLKRLTDELFHMSGTQVVSGPAPKMTGDCDDICGDCSGLDGHCDGMRGDVSGLTGDCTGLHGNVSGLTGDCSGVYGGCSGVSGDLGLCELSSADREQGVATIALIRDWDSIAG